MLKIIRFVLCSAIPLALVGCTIHPAGEKEERQSAMEAGKALSPTTLPSLSDTPTQDELVERALLTNPGLQQKYWEWRAAIEQIPQDGTQSSNVALFAGMDITRGNIRSDSTSLGLGNDPMADIVLPPKLSTAAKRALENARAAGQRFRMAQFDLRAKVISGYSDFVLTTEMIRLEEDNSKLIQTAYAIVQAKNSAGTGAQSDVLRTASELDMSQNQMESLKALLPEQLAVLNALLDRAPQAPLKVPASVSAETTIGFKDDELLALALKRNPELRAQANEETAGKASIKLAKLQYLPDISLSANSDLAGVTQSLAGMVTLPLFRYEAINAAVSQAEANLRAREAARRQSENDIEAKLVGDINSMRDAERQIALFERALLPRAQQTVTVIRSSYESGQGTLLDYLDAERSLLVLEKMKAELRATHDKALASIEAAIAEPLQDFDAHGE